MRTAASLCLFTALGLALPTAAQTATVVVRKGDPIPGFAGNVRTIERFAINDFGEWLMLAETSNATTPYVVLRGGFLTLLQGQPLALPPGSSISGFNSLTMNNHGRSAWEFDLEGPPTSGNSAVYFNTKLIAQKGELVNLPGSFDSTATWAKFGQLGGKVGCTKLNDNNQVVLGCEVKDTTIANGTIASVIRLDLDAVGNVITGTSLGTEKDFAPQSTETKLGGVLIGGGSEGTLTLDLNNNGDVIWQGKYGLGSAGIGTIWVNDEVVAQEGKPSAAPGETYTTLNKERVSINDAGDYLFTAGISGPNQTNEVLVKNGKVFARKRNAPAAISPYLLLSWGLAPGVFVSNGGDVFHFATWTGPGSTDRGIFFNDQLIARRGVTEIEGVQVDLFPDNAFVYTVSPNGRYVMFNAILADESDVACIMDLGRATPVPDCGGNPATLYRKKGFPLIGSSVRMSVDDGHGLGVTPFLLVSDSTIPVYPPCGLSTGWGELIIDFGPTNPMLILIGTPWGGPAVDIDLPIANSPAIIGYKFYAQGIFFDVGNQIPGPPAFTTTNAVELEIGAP